MRMNALISGAKTILRTELLNGVTKIIAVKKRITKRNNVTQQNKYCIISLTRKEIYLIKKNIICILK